MQGEQIGEETGKVVLRRVVSSEGGDPKMEVTVQSNGKTLGIETRSTVTYLAAFRRDGSLYGEGQGILTTKGGETATFKTQGVGRLLGGGSVSYRGASYCYSDSPKLSRLNAIACIFEYDADAEGNTKAKLWEWR